MHGAAAWAAGAVVAFAIFVGSFGVIWTKFIVPLWRRVVTGLDLIERELNHNGGDSVKDHAAEAKEQAIDAAVTSALASNGILHISERLDAFGAEQQHLTRIVTDSLEWQRDHENLHRRDTDH